MVGRAHRARVPERRALLFYGVSQSTHTPSPSTPSLSQSSSNSHTHKKSNIFADAGVEWQYYRYFDSDTVGLDFAGMTADLEAAPEGSVVLLHGEL